MKEDSLAQMYFVLALLICASAMIAPFALSTGAASNYRNVSVATTLNVTNTFPEVILVDLDTITLTAGSATLVQCNVTVRDFDGFGQVQNVNATFFDSNVASPDSADDNNNHYTNGSCTLLNNGSVTGNYSCHFNVEYYANNGTNWNCTSEVRDNSNTVGNNTNVTTIQTLLALNVTPLLDFGSLIVGNISASIEANSTNLGNTAINVSVRGYGGVEGDGLAMVCDQRNISIDEQRFSLNQSEPWLTMTSLATAPQVVQGVTIIQRTNDTAGGETFNSSYWRIRVPSSTNPSGICNGTIIFQAELP